MLASPKLRASGHPFPPIVPYPALTLFPHIVIISCYLISSGLVLTVLVHTLILWSGIPITSIAPDSWLCATLFASFTSPFPPTLGCLPVVVYKPPIHVCIH